jgi:hypothetical protein
MPIRYQITLLLVTAGLVISVVRHGLETNWGPWGGVEYFVAWWLVHFVLLKFLISLVRFIVSICSLAFSTVDTAPTLIKLRLPEERRSVDRGRLFYDQLKAPVSDSSQNNNIRCHESHGVFWSNARLTSHEQWAKEFQ